MSGIGQIGELKAIERLKKIEKMDIYLPLKDSGIDFVAVKDDRFFQIQVKTSLFHKNSYFWFDLYKNKLIFTDNTCYILVCYTMGRRKFMGKADNFIVLPSLSIMNWIAEGKMAAKASDNNCFNLYIYPVEESKRWLYKNKGLTIDLTDFWNGFSFFY